MIRRAAGAEYWRASKAKRGPVELTSPKAQMLLST
jgi:hypothetical protein